VTQRQYQGYLETRNALAMATEAGIDVHVGHQYPYNLRERMAQFLDMPQDRIRIIGYPIGGAFGGKLDYGPEPYAAALALATQRPVKVVFGRGEDIATAGVRENTEILIRSALDAAGNVLARDVDMVMDNGASSGELVLLTSLVALFGAGNYRTGPVRARARLVYTNTPPTGAMRGVTGVPLVTALEKHVDHICHVLERDRREYRLEQLGGDGFRLPTGQVLHDAGILRKAFDALEERVPWHAALARRAAGPLRGIGLAATAWIVNSLPGSASVRVMADGRIELTTGANDNGSGSLATGVRQILAEEFGVAHRDIDINLPDTRDNLYDGGSQGSRTTQVAGEAARLAARVVREKIARIAAPSLGAAATDLQFVDGRIVNPRDPARAMCFVDAVQLAIQQGEDLSGRGDYALAPVVCGPSNTSGVFIPAMTCPTYHVHYCEVEVDPVTGNVRVLRYVVCQEVGTAINPREIRGQIQGGVTQGIGYALYESLALREGRYVERSLEAYRMPLAIDIPTVEVILLEHPTKEGPFGAKGIAEPPIAPAPVAILNAVADAVGEAFDRLPITPEDVLAALERRELAQSGTPRQR
jgi:CO/xanthine dehydrogenase Mo-binding subunit